MLTLAIFSIAIMLNCQSLKVYFKTIISDRKLEIHSNQAQYLRCNNTKLQFETSIILHFYDFYNGNDSRGMIRDSY